MRSDCGGTGLRSNEQLLGDAAVVPVDDRNVLSGRIGPHIRGLGYKFCSSSVERVEGGGLGSPVR